MCAPFSAYMHVLLESLAERTVEVIFLLANLVRNVKYSFAVRYHHNLLWASPDICLVPGVSRGHAFHLCIFYFGQRQVSGKLVLASVSFQ